MIKTEEVFVFYPRPFTPNFKVLVDTTDITTRIFEAGFNKPVTTGIGDFKIRLINVGGRYSNLWVGGETVYFYANLIDATTLKFKGRLDFIKEVLTEEGYFLDLEGRHISYDLTEVYVSKSYSNQDGSTVLKNLVDTFLTGYTYTNVTDPIGTNITVNWSNKPFWDCVNDICVLCGADCYVDDDKDFHFFLENSITQTQDAIVEGYNLKQLRNFGKDSFFEKTKIIVYGSAGGIPVIATAGSGTREKVIIDNSITTTTEAQDRANKELADLTLSNLPPQGTSITKGLAFTNTGDNIWISTPRQQIHGLYKIIELKHKVGTNVGTWLTECVVEKEEKGTSQVLKERTKKELAIVVVENPNRLSYSYNFTFDDTTNIASQSNTTVSEGFLKLVSGQTTGTMLTSTKTATSNISYAELRWEGENLGASTFEVSVDGLNYQTITRNQLLTITFVGLSLKIRVILNSDSNNPNPKVDSLAILYK